ncbi:MAG: hypothetical protein AAGK82_09565 [Pseudomonadota bacterium]
MGGPFARNAGVQLPDVSADQVGIDSKPLTADETFLQVACRGCFEDMTGQIAFAEAAISVL